MKTNNWARRSKNLRAATLGLVALVPSLSANADESGVSFWLPGQFGTLAAVPVAPGWSLASIYYHSSVSAGANRRFPLGGSISFGLEADADLLLVSPSYAFEQPVLGAQAAVALTGLVGRTRVQANLSASGPAGGTLQFADGDSVTGAGDLYALGSLRWQQGVNNALAYTMVGAPVGSYSAGRLANIGTGHWSLDAGGGYTYFDQRNEFSAVLGLTYNFSNPDTDYQNGIDAHLDWSASRFVAEGTQLGLVGYGYYQITGDSGGGAKLGDFKSRINGIGPQLGQFVPIGGLLWYFNLKAYWEFDARNRPEGWNTWLTVSVPLGQGSTP